MKLYSSFWYSLLSLTTFCYSGGGGVNWGCHVLPSSLKATLGVKFCTDSFVWMSLCVQLCAVHMVVGTCKDQKSTTFLETGSLTGTYLDLTKQARLADEQGSSWVCFPITGIIHTCLPSWFCPCIKISHSYLGDKNVMNPTSSSLFPLVYLFYLCGDYKRIGYQCPPDSFSLAV